MGAVGGDRLGLYPGEAMAFEVSLAGVLAGEASLVVGEPVDAGDGARLEVTSRVASVGIARWIREVRDDLTSTIDVATGRPLAGYADVAFGARRFHGTTRYDGSAISIEWHNGDRTPRRLRYDLGDATPHDAHSAMAAVRTWEGSPGQVRRLVVLGGRRLWRTDVTWTGVEAVTSSMGTLQAVRLDGVAQRVDRRLQPEQGKRARRFTVWLSDDADRVPLRVAASTELGEVAIDLVGYQRR
jgi:hypothetical protein